MANEKFTLEEADTKCREFVKTLFQPCKQQAEGSENDAQKEGATPVVTFLSLQEDELGFYAFCASLCTSDETWTVV